MVAVREREAAAEAETQLQAEPQEPPVAAAPEKPRRSARELSAAEKAARTRAVQDAQRRDADAEARAMVEAEERLRRQTEERREEEEARRKADEEAESQRATEEARHKAEGDQTGMPVAAETAAPSVAKPSPAAEAPARPVRPAATEEGDGDDAAKRKRRPGKADPRKLSLGASRRSEPRRRAERLSVNTALNEEEQERVRSLASLRRAQERERRQQQAEALRSGEHKVVREVVIPETITVAELANRMAVRGADVIKSLMQNGIMATINQAIDADTAEVIVGEFGHRSKRVAAADVEVGLRGPEDVDTDLQTRAPVVTVMGHVDHGKTSLLDALRSTDVAGREAGGITQHIGAYQVRLESGAAITFIDTPGHAAFTAMRARGAKVTDIVVLVVAADDGVMPQTVEAIHHARSAEVPIIVAVNKIDAPGADPKKVKQGLLQHEIVIEELGGDVQCVEVSALKRQGLDTLEEAILLQSELLDLRANPDRAAEGVVVEAKLERGRGAVATVLVKRGTLKVGDIFVAGSEWGRVRALVDERGQNRDYSGPSEPVEVLGLQGVPSAGDDFVVVEDEARARDIAKYRQGIDRQKKADAGARGTLEQMFDQIAAGEAKALPLVIKGDVQGSIEAIQGSLDKVSTDQVKAQMLHIGVGGINESDVTLAKASNALIIAFNVRANAQARELARREGVEIRYYSIIYDLVDDLKAMMSGMLDPLIKEHFLGYAEILQVFHITKVGKVAGCRVTEGVIKRGSGVRLLRDNVVIHEGRLGTLKRHKDEVREVNAGTECGMGFENYQDLQVGDQIECFETEEVQQTL
ncbi:MAG: translation initiation factor IF-2, partial [Acetobacterales bacterium]